LVEGIDFGSEYGEVTLGEVSARHPIQRHSAAQQCPYKEKNSPLYSHIIQLLYPTLKTPSINTRILQTLIKKSIIFHCHTALSVSSVLSWE
jgi:hypothetical protein